MNLPPVITIDGLSGSGKGTISLMLAKYYGWHFLDSGSLYRIVALACMQASIVSTDISAITDLIQHSQIVFEFSQDTPLPNILLNGMNITDDIRNETVAAFASEVAQHASIRQSLTGKQLAFRQWPGLVADGRDMGTIIFPDAQVKFFLSASPEERAYRRHQQLKAQGIDVSLDALLTEIKARDARDQSRAVAPTRPAIDAVQIDTSSLSIDEVYQIVLYRSLQVFPR